MESMRLHGIARRHPWPVSIALAGVLFAAAWAGLLRLLLTLVLFGIVGWLFRTWSRDPRRGRDGAPVRPSVGAVRVHVPRRKRVSVLVWPVLLLFAAVGVFALAIGARQLAQQETRLWTARPVEATVVRSTLERPSKSRRGGWSYEPRVLHRYRLGGRIHESDRLYPLPRRLPREAALAAIALYRPGTKVYTNVPGGEPGAAFLVPRREWGLYGLFPFGLAFLGFPAGLAWVLLRRSARH